LLMAIVIVAGFSGYWWLAILALPVFVSALLGISFKRSVKQPKTKEVRQPALKHSHAESL